MNQAITFDTHRFVKHLIDGGFTELQAETLADEQVSLLNANLATKTEIANIDARVTNIDERIVNIDARIANIDERIANINARIEALRKETKTEIEALRQETKANIESLQSSLLKWIFSAMIAQGGVIVALISLLGK